MDKNIRITLTSEIKADQKPVDPKLLKEIEALTPSFLNALKAKRPNRTHKQRFNSTLNNIL